MAAIMTSAAFAQCPSQAKKEKKDGESKCEKCDKEEKKDAK